jgi:dephospho-coA kinase
VNPCGRAYVIGLTGQSGAGKTTVCGVFRREGFDVIDADLISREVTRKGEPCLNELAEAFGSGILLPDGSLDRKKLGSIVFSDSERLRQLDGICYPYIIFRIIRCIEELSASGSKLIILDAPTLFESNADDLCDLIISVTADEKLREERITARDHISPEAARKRFNSQYSEHFFVSHSDFVIKNNKTPEILVAKAEEAADKIKEYYNAKKYGEAGAQT